jgi:methylase of polypeptide subunit release factors
LNDHGWLSLEVGANQAGRVCALLAAGNFDGPEIIKDYNNIERVVIAKQRIFTNG